MQEQLELESTYSKKGKDDLLHNEIDIDSMFFKVIKCIDDLHLDAKGAEATQALYLEILSSPKERHIQSIGTCIGTRLGKYGSDSIELGVRILEAAADTGLYDVVMFAKSVIIRPLIRVSDEVQRKINTFNYLPPMLVEPKPWTNNEDGGYLSIKHHAILKTKNKHSKEVCLSILNKLQEVELEMDTEILFNYIVTEELKHDIEMYGKYIDKSFWYMWQYDFRGRMYTAGYEINFQSTEFKKALHNLKHKQLITK